MNFDTIKDICEAIQKVSDFIWEFPTGISWYHNIPILGELSFAILVLVGSGIFFTLRLRFVQIRRFRYGIRLLKEKSESKEGISPLASFLLSTAMRVGPGNILGVTGAIAAGGPGALFWMWVSAFFGMATAYCESTLSQVFRESRGRDFVGGFPFYGRRLLGNFAVVGITLSFLYLIYALLCFPSSGFNTVSAIGMISEKLTGTTIASDSTFYWITASVLFAMVILISFGGIRKVSKVTSCLVPVMAIVYFLTVAILVALNIDRLPGFFSDVFCGAFSPDAIFGGAIGTALSQGIKRGLMSNEAGQGTMTMAAAASNVSHPSDQGCIQSVGVFLDTMVICTLTGFVVVMGNLWSGDSAEQWFELGKLPKFIASADVLAGSSGVFARTVTIVMSLCFGLFAFTTMLGFLSFSEICAARISSRRPFLITVRVLCLVVIGFGFLTFIGGFDLSMLWNLADLANILMVLVNVPLLWLGLRYVLKES